MSRQQQQQQQQQLQQRAVEEAAAAKANEEARRRLVSARRRMMQTDWYLRKGLSIEAMHSEILRLSALHQYSGAGAGAVIAAAAAAAPPGANGGEQDGRGGGGGAPAAAAAAAAAGAAPPAPGAAAQQGAPPPAAAAVAAAAPPRRRPRPRSETAALLCMMGRAQTQRDAALAADALGAVRLSLARQGVIEPLGPEVVTAFLRMVARCRASEVLVSAMRRPVDTGLFLSRKALHYVMASWAARAQRFGPPPQDAAGGGGGGGAEEGGGREQQQQDPKRRRRRTWGAVVGGAACHPGARDALEAAEAVYAAMRPAGVVPNHLTAYILVRTAVNAGLRERAAALEAAVAAADGARRKPATERLLAAAAARLEREIERGGVLELRDSDGDSGGGAAEDGV
ncbi:MAG: hypothetical protein J3K34DRAFT_524508 [Monoraphidium minutum]|nr:MAG: hypothetical protein J3K34DRAFT_524508 [Monoraphidium minutum]